MDWVEGGTTEEIDMTAMASLTTELESEDGEFTDEFIDQLALAAKGDFLMSAYELRSRYIEFLATKIIGLNESDIIEQQREDPALHRLLSSRCDHIQKEVERRIRQKEEKTVDSLVSKCVSWATRNGLKKLARSDVSMFLTDENETLSYASERTLWQKVNFALKTGKIP